MITVVPPGPATVSTWAPSCCESAGAEAGLSLGEDAVWLPDPVIRDRKLPICSGPFIDDRDLTYDVVAGEGMFQRIHDEFGHDQTETLRLTRCGAAIIANDFQ
jgi:hypothetical protein